MHLPLRAISAFHAVAVTGSINGAASELGVTPSAVSQQVQSLELHLGTSLFTKSGRGLLLTEAGERYFQLIGAPVEQIVEATERLRGFRSVTTLTVRASPSLATKWLVPRLHRFVDAHPDLELRLDGTSEQTDFSKENVDLDVRHGEGNWPGLFVEALATERFRPVCSPSLHGEESLDVEELLRCRLIHSVKSQVQWNAWFRAAGLRITDRWRRVLFDRTHMAIDAAVRGMGVALESDIMTNEELTNGTLVCPVRAPPQVSLITQWIVCPENRLRQRKVQLFLDWLRSERVSASIVEEN